MDNFSDSFRRLEVYSSLADSFIFHGSRFQSNAALVPPATGNDPQDVCLVSSRGPDVQVGGSNQRRTEVGR